jgi:hypothetical protein
MFREERKFKSRHHLLRTCCKERQAVGSNATAHERRARRRPFWFTVPKRALEFSFPRRSSFTSSSKETWDPSPKCDDWSVKLITLIQFRVKVKKCVWYMPLLSFSFIFMFFLSFLIYVFADIVSVDFTFNRNVWFIVSLNVREGSTEINLTTILRYLHPDRLWGLPNLPSNVYRGLFPRG